MILSLYLIDYSLFAITIISSVVYVILLSKIMDGWDDTEEWEIPTNHKPITKISIVIAARNEKENIENCLNSILASDYPKSLYNIIVVNDHSEDNTAQIVENLKCNQIKLINLAKNNGKKYALEFGIAAADGELIACTDADCIVPELWLRTIDSYYSKHKPQCIAGPIAYQHNRTLIERFQFLDSINNMCVTANGILRKSYYIANGANIIFTKEAFNQVGGYRKKEQFASGDDVFLIQAIADKHPNKIAFLKSKSAIISTQPEKSLDALKAQRTRWATKSKAYSNKRITQIQGFVFYFVLLILLNLLFCPFGSGLSLFGFIFALFIKWTMDFLYLNKLCDFFGRTKALKSFFGASLGFMYYILFAGWKALFPSKYNWKGRETS